MEPFGVVEYQVDYPLYLRFYKFQARRGYRKFLSLLVYILLSVGIIFGGLFLFLRPGLGILIFFVLYLFALGFKVYMDFYFPRVSFNKSREIIDATHKFQLFSDHFIAESKGENSSGRSTTKYLALHNAYELKDLYILYITQRQAFLLPKSAMSDETSNQLRDVLHTHLGQKFILVGQR